MSDALVIRLPRERDAPLTWVGVDHRGQLTTPPGSGGVSSLAAVAGTRRVVLLVPGEDVLHLAAAVPPGSESRAAQLLPFALEEQIAADIDSQHFAAGRRLPDGTLAADVVSRAQMDAWLALQAEWGVSFDAIHSESECVPELADHLVLLIERDTLTLRVPGRRPALLPTEDLWLSLELGLGPESADLSQHHVIVHATAVDWQRHSAAVEALRDRFASLKVQLLSSGVLPFLAQHLHETKPVNLRQGQYAPQRRHAGSWRAWRLAAGLAAALLVLHVGAQAAQIYRLRAQEREADAAIAQTLQTHAPGMRYTPGFRQAIERRLATGGANAQDRASLLGLLTAIAQAHPGADTRIEALRFQRGSVELRVEGPDAGSLERINQALRGMGLKSELTSGAPRNDRYEGRMQVSAS